MATKYTKAMRLGNAIGKPCPYCGRAMHFDRVLTGAFPTREHVIPKSQGGQRVVYACLDCNEAKGDMSEAEFRERRNAMLPV